MNEVTVFLTSNQIESLYDGEYREEICECEDILLDPVEE